MEETNAASLGIKKMFSVGLFKTINSLNSIETDVSLKFTVLSFKEDFLICGAIISFSPPEIVPTCAQEVTRKTDNIIK